LGSQLGGWPQPGRLWRPRLGNHMLALSDWRSLTDMCRRHVPGPRSGGGPHWAPAFGGWPRLALRPPRLGGGPDWTSWTSPPSGRRGRLSRDSRGWPHLGRNLGSQLGGWPQPGRLWRPRLGNHMLALSDWRSLTDMCRRHVPGPRSGGGPHWAPAFGGWPRLAPRGRPHSGHSLGSQLGGWPQTGPTWGVAPAWPLVATSPWQSHVGAL
jgi:hypothetical protein